MVKRPKSPTVEEDTTYFTVYGVYPLNANWVVEEDQIKCAKWAAECIGSEHLISIYHKPKSRGMILLEIDKTRFTAEHHYRLLGEHRWNEILKEPEPEEEDQVTKVFYCFYSKGRDAQKDGWKEISIKRPWFKGWNPGENEFVKPYPQTYWCELPPEDKTNKPLCRPLPAERKPPPPKPETKPVVGSSRWVEATSAPVKAPVWGNKSGAPEQPQSKPVAPSQAAESVPPPASIAHSQSLGNKWGKPMTLKAFTTEEKKPGPFGWSNIARTPSGSKSPFTEPAPSGPVNAWTKPLKISPSERSALAKGLDTPITPNSASAWDSSPLASPLDPWLTPDEEKPKGRSSDNQPIWPGRLKHLPPPPPPTEGQTLLTPEDLEEDDLILPIDSLALSDITSTIDKDDTDWGTVVDPVENINWDELYEERNKGQAIACPTHGIGVCKKGICADMAKAVRAHERNLRGRGGGRGGQGQGKRPGRKP